MACILGVIKVQPDNSKRVKITMDLTMEEARYMKAALLSIKEQSNLKNSPLMGVQLLLRPDFSLLEKLQRTTH